MASHAAITDPNVHEPKGLAAAAVDKVYVSLGAGAGQWQKIESDQIDTTSIWTVNKMVLTAFIVDIGTAGNTYIVVPCACTLTKIYTVISGAITGADEVLTAKNSAGAAITSGSITITQSGSAAGDIDSCSPSANNTFTSGTALKIENSGASTGPASAVITCVFTVTGAIS